MSVLRFYWIDQAGHIRHPADEIECIDDSDALAKAAAMVETQSQHSAIEIWDRARRVGKVSAMEDREQLGLRPCFLESWPDGIAA